ncbi:MAG TPA: DUF1848 domain-containing protein [Candidatus Ozemobacteraceae bacterium]|nr:DUF1848 domain-containing protein [Candidatus Ozemobacteraceae bacterium]
MNAPPEFHSETHLSPAPPQRVYTDFRVSFMKNPHGDRVTIETPEGPREAVAPVIVSASRSTDLPAFYADWFARRFRAGWARWVNPFNRQSQWVSFERTRAIVFWSKNPRPLLAHLSTFSHAGWYLTFTLNDYVREGLEPGVPPLAERLDTFAAFSARVGSERVIWRADPLLLLDNLGVDGLLARVQAIGEKLRGKTRRLVFSFADTAEYRNVRANLKKAGIPFRDWNEATMRTAAAGLSLIGRSLGIEVVSCAETVDLSPFGIQHGRCIDDELLYRLFPGDLELQRSLGYMPVQPTLTGAGLSRPSLKDKGQRKACGCIISKDIGSYNTCPHGCVYCYANASPGQARRQAASHDPNADSLTPVPAEEHPPRPG